MTLVEENSTLKLVKSLLENYQDNTAKVEGLSKLNQSESNSIFAKEVSILQQQLQYLKSAINCLNESDQELIERFYKDGESLEKCAREMYLSRSQAFRRKNKILEKIANYYEKLVN